MEEKKEEEEKKFEKGSIQFSKIEEKNEKSVESNKENEQINLNLNLDNANIEDLMNIIETKNIETDGTMIEYNGEQFIFKGQLDDKKNICGKGSIHYNDGRIYEGIFENGKLNGIGKYISTNGDIYEGFFNNGNLNGKGTIIKTKINKNKSINKDDSSVINEDNDHNKYKIIYKGDIKDFKKEGNGIESCDDFRYEGHFSNDMKNGEGFLIYTKSGDKYKGEFKNDEITGKGNYIWANGDSYTGDFIDGKMEGNGIYKWPDGTEYIGEYKNTIREGKGIFKWKNGVMFEGNFINGKPHGKGQMKYKNKIIDVEYENGICLGNKDAMKELKSN